MQAVRLAWPVGAARCELVSVYSGVGGVGGSAFYFLFGELCIFKGSLKFSGHSPQTAFSTEKMSVRGLPAAGRNQRDGVWVD